MRILSFTAILFIAFQANAQHPGVNCVPVQGNGWQGCAPINSEGQNSSSLPAQKWIDHYGAIVAYGHGGQLGVSTDMTTETEAKESAMADCKVQGGGSHCELLISYVNGCVAMLVGTKAYNAASSSTIEKATQLAMKGCSHDGNAKCHVYYSACTLPVRIQ